MGTVLTRPDTNGRRSTRQAAILLHDATERERAGKTEEAISRYEAAIAAAERGGADLVLAEALRGLAVARHKHGESALAQELCRRSYATALEARNDLLAAEALNTLGATSLMSGSVEAVREFFLRALALGGSRGVLRARVEQNLGILSNIQGDLDQARRRYESSLAAYESAGDEQGCALAYHNLGMVAADLEQWDDADRHFARSLEIAERTGNRYLQGLCLVNHAEVHVARQRYDEAMRDAETALEIFDRLGARDAKAGVYRVLGVIYRETGRVTLAESRLQLAIELSVATGSVLNEAEATRELALYYQGVGRNQEALSALFAAHRLFGQLDARRDLVHVDGKVAELEGTYLVVVGQWAQSIESADTYTFGHCERVARNAGAVARALQLDEHEQTTIRLGAYLHDVGKLKVPPEILNKPGPLTPDESAVVKMHPLWGIELLEGITFPWALKPIIRWHHERYDGAGYPDGLCGDDVPLAAQVVGVADVYDALTSARSYRPALTPAEAAAEMTMMRGAWSPQVYAVAQDALPAAARTESSHTYAA
jgi:putative nucleotidyltransferase with HDIG domain